ncbi:MAG TPA: YfiR family protein [Verrucomicrobiae bacterium]|nr:YfiR family protein [Verrucomicrobiae bacterium]
MRISALKLIVAVAIACVSACTQAADTMPKTPYELKAFLLCNFAIYTEWPKEAFASDNSPFVLGILGKDPFGKDIDVLKGKTIKGRPLVVKYYTDIDQISGCHLLFISSSEKKHLPEILKAVEHSSVLTVSEIDGFVAQNGMIDIFMEETRPGFVRPGYRINQAATEKAGIRIGSYVLKLAKT